jgi:hypothetical protein
MAVARVTKITAASPKGFQQAVDKYQCDMKTSRIK